jgi:hypothetical protein
MQVNKTKTRVRALALLGAAAVVSMAALVTTLGEEPSGSAVAGSGDAPTNTVYSKPNVPGMTGGATATWEPPGTTEATMSASPPIKH